jgi:hemerythrin-like domain-containing protein
MTHPVDELYDEHRLIERMLSELEQRLAAQTALPCDFVETALDFFRTFADGLHHHKEEKALFPALESAGVPSDGGPVAVMLYEHTLGRQCLATIRECLPAARGGSASAEADIRRAAGDYIDLLRRHIWKEDNILFMIARNRLTSDQQIQDLQSRFDEENRTGLHRRYEDILDEITTAKPQSPACA